MSDDVRDSAIKTLKNEFDQVIEKTKNIREENPAELFAKMKLLAEAKDLCGDLWAAWENKAKIAKTNKKEVINHVKIYGAILKPEKPHTNDKTKIDTLPLVAAKEAKTDKMKEAVAELIAKTYEDVENTSLSSAGHYKNKYESLTEKINILKKRYEHLVNVMRGLG